MWHNFNKFDLVFELTWPMFRSGLDIIRQTFWNVSQRAIQNQRIFCYYKHLDVWTNFPQRDPYLTFIPSFRPNFELQFRRTVENFLLFRRNLAADEPSLFQICVFGSLHQKRIHAKKIFVIDYLQGSMFGPTWLPLSNTRLFFHLPFVNHFPPVGLSVPHFRAGWLLMIGDRQPSGLN